MPHIHALNFRIHFDSTYDQRYASVVEAAKRETVSSYWDETTSCLLIESSKNSRQLAESIDANSQFAGTKDMLVVINLSEKGYTAIGDVKDGDLHRLMSKR